jgi:hypothetical protein
MLSVHQYWIILFYVKNKPYDIVRECALILELGVDMNPSIVIHIL